MVLLGLVEGFFSVDFGVGSCLGFILGLVLESIQAWFKIYSGLV